MIAIDELGDRLYGTPVYLEYEAPEVRRSEILRYAGVRTAGAAEKSADTADPEGMEALLEEILALASGEFTYRVAFLRFRPDADVSEFPLNRYLSESENLMKNLSGCSEAIIFAATVGAGIDRLIRRYERIAPAKSLLLQAYGAERVEALCDQFNQDLSSVLSGRGWHTHPRFSPGYGDLSIEIQPVLLSLLDAEKRLGITLGSSYLMSPSKSVTAVIGLERTL